MGLFRRGNLNLKRTKSIAGASEHQVVLAWLLARSPAVLPIPGSGSAEHIEENVAAASLELTAEEVEAITAGSS